MSDAKVIEFARKHGYDTAQKLDPWNGFEVYEPIIAGDEIAIVGLPLLILVKGNKIRMSTGDEALRHLDETE
jgi:hypothetical protein